MILLVLHKPASGQLVHIRGCVRITLCFSNFFNDGMRMLGNVKDRTSTHLSLFAFQDTSPNATDPCYLSLCVPTDANIETFLTVHIFHFLAFRFSFILISIQLLHSIFILTPVFLQPLHFVISSLPHSCGGSHYETK